MIKPASSKSLSVFIKKICSRLAKIIPFSPHGKINLCKLINVVSPGMKKAG